MAVPAEKVRVMQDVIEEHAQALDDLTYRVTRLESTVAGLLIPMSPLRSSRSAEYRYKIYAEPLIGEARTVQVTAKSDREARGKVEKQFTTRLVKTKILSKVAQGSTRTHSSPYQLLTPIIMQKTAQYMRAKYRRVPEAVHAHDLTRCSLKREMEERYPRSALTTLFKPPVQIGEAIHTFVEALPDIDRAQVVFERRVNRHLVVGKPDIVTGEAVYNLKYRERLYTRPLEHDVLRAGIYAWLARKPYGHIIYINP